MSLTSVLSRIVSTDNNIFLPSDYQWLIPPYDYAELDKFAKEGNFPSFSGLFPALGYCVFFGIARIVLTRFVFEPLALSSMKLKVKPFKSNSTVDRIVKSKKISKPNSDDVMMIAKETKLSEAEVNQYLWNKRRHLTTKKRVTKFVEAIWRFCFYLYFCYLGITTLFLPSPVSWITDTKEHWLNWPRQPVNSAVLFIYQIQLGSYLHQLMWTEVSRSDAIEMIVHHITTIVLVMISYLTDFTRIGASIFLCHDIADIFLEMGKCFVYVSNTKGNEWASKVCDGFFACFAITFFVSRLIIYPRYLVYSLLFEAPEIMGWWNGYYAFAGLLCTLQVLHVFWFYLICRMIFKLFSTGIEKDVRSDNEEEEDEPEGGDDQDKKKK